jgi:hypothetical protein
VAGREQQRIDDRVNTPRVDRDAAHRVTDRVPAVGRERPPLHTGEEIPRQLVHHPSTDSGPPQREDDLERTVHRKNQEAGDDDPDDQAAGSGGPWQALDNRAHRPAHRLVAEYVIDQHLHRPRLEQGQRGAQGRGGDNRHPPSRVRRGVTEQPPVAARAARACCFSPHRC